MSVFAKYGDFKGMHGSMDLLEPDRRKKIKYLLGLLAWSARLMNILDKQDVI